MKHTVPLISIYIPTHNRRDLLKRAIDSVLNQTYPNFEILVCSDGSTDGTDELMADYCEQFSNISYVKNETPQGACSARNKCIARAQGEFITGLDDDDMFHPKRLEILFDAFDDKYAFLCAEGYEVDLSKELPDFSNAEIDNTSSHEISLSNLFNKNMVGNQVFTYTERFKAVGGFDENMPAWQDYEMWVRLIKQFGSAQKNFKKTYYSDIDHKRARISISSNRYKGCEKFYQKYAADLSSAQLKNSEVRKYLIGRGEMPLLKLLALYNRPMIKFWLKAVLIKCKLVK